MEKKCNKSWDDKPHAHSGTNSQRVNTRQSKDQELLLTASDQSKAKVKLRKTIGTSVEDNGTWYQGNSKQQDISDSNTG